MAKYTVTFVVDASICTTVEADSSEEAGELAEAEIDEPHLCHHCARALDVSGFTGQVIVDLQN